MVRVQDRARRAAGRARARAAAAEEEEEAEGEAAVEGLGREMGRLGLSGPGENMNSRGAAAGAGLAGMGEIPSQTRGPLEESPSAGNDVRVSGFFLFHFCLC